MNLMFSDLWEGSVKKNNNNNNKKQLKDELLLPPAKIMVDGC